MLTALVTSGPTFEPIDPVRFIGNRSSGRQGHAIASALAAAGVHVTLVTGPVSLPAPEGVNVVRVMTAEDMRNAALAALPVDMAVFAAAVSDWSVKHVHQRKIKKSVDLPPILSLTETPDILHTIANHSHHRPKLVVGFAAETHDVIAYATAKRVSKNADWIVANKVSATEGFENTYNSVTLIRQHGSEAWDNMSKIEIAERLVARMIESIREVA